MVLGTVVIAGGTDSYEITNPGSGFPSDGSVYAYWDSAVLGGPTNTGGARLGSSASAGLTTAVLTSSQKNLSYKLLVLASRLMHILERQVFRNQTKLVLVKLQVILILLRINMSLLSELP